ncbi:LA_2272 family surface repeat-containing protein [Persicobacter diffluens]|uniref:PhaC PHA synthase n=1 Tax=Persicobacter diffluens TaxID=981 RepID=A0AAN4VX63_9BACT|nr:hypothetical protein PEDI_11250 [Persicobacter diffluens]
MRNLIIILLLVFPLSVYCQSEERKNYFPIWTFHQKNINIHGVSIGLGSSRAEYRNTNTNGLKFEIIGTGLLCLFLFQSPIQDYEGKYLELRKEPKSEIINGLNISISGTSSNSISNGISAGLVGQYNYQINGISFSCLMNFSEIHNGLQMALHNESYIVNGLQIGFANNSKNATGLSLGFVNSTENLKGIQIGVWNTNQKRTLPLINWSFK